jgi:NifU-like protein involved in Fe-S cluster formation
MSQWANRSALISALDGRKRTEELFFIRGCVIIGKLMGLPSDLAQQLQNPYFAPLQGVGAQGRAENAACGDELTIEVEAQEGRFQVRYQVRGCAALVAGSSLWVAHVDQIEAAQAEALDPKALFDAAGGLPARSQHVARVIERAWRQALAGLAKR